MVTFVISLKSDGMTGQMMGHCPVIVCVQQTHDGTLLAVLFKQWDDGTDEHIQSPFVMCIIIAKQ